LTIPQFIHDDVKLNYEVAGNPDKPWLFFSHSLGTNLSMWDPQLATFSSSFALLRFDHRGHGQSSARPGDYTVESLAEDVLALADHVGAERFHFCGLSLGGLIGQWLGLYAPERLGKLVLCNTAARIGSAEGWTERMRVVESDGITAIVESGLQRWFTPQFICQHPDIAERFRSMILSTVSEGYVAHCAALRDTDFQSRIHAVPVPVLVVCGRYDPVTTVAEANFLVDSIADARILQLDAAHLSNVEQADEFNRTVAQFLA